MLLPETSDPGHNRSRHISATRPQNGIPECSLRKVSRSHNKRCLARDPQHDSSSGSRASLASRSTQQIRALGSPYKSLLNGVACCQCQLPNVVAHFQPSSYTLAHSRTLLRKLQSTLQPSSHRKRLKSYPHGHLQRLLAPSAGEDEARHLPLCHDAWVPWTVPCNDARGTCEHRETCRHQTPAARWATAGRPLRLPVDSIVCRSLSYALGLKFLVYCVIIVVFRRNSDSPAW